MKKLSTSLILLVALVINAWAQGVNLKNMDKNYKPQDDFFMYVNGNWDKNTQIPASESSWGSFLEILENNRSVLKAILEEAAKKTATKGSDEQLVGDFYTSGMDTVKLEQLGWQPLKPELEIIDKIVTADDIMNLVARMQRNSLGSPFGVFVGADAKDSKINALQIGQGGTSLPSRAYYLENNERFEKIRAQYLEHIAKMFTLMDIDAETAKKYAQTIFAIEKRFAEAQRTPVNNRDPQRRYNKKNIDDLKQMTFNINWDNYFAAVGAKNVSYVLVGAPEFIAMFDRMLGDVPANDWKIYFKWKLLLGSAPFLSSSFRKENFNFYSTTLRGVKEMKPRWKDVQAIVDGNVGDALGKLYVAKAFPPEAKQKMEEMIQNIKEAFAERIKKLDWMSEATKAEALKKLNAITYKIGYPSVWKDYKQLDIRKDDLLGNLRRVAEMEHNADMLKIGQPVDKNDWFMTPPTVNAYYNPTVNEIVFPAGILQPPFFDFKADDAVNYGAIGAVIGHELTHGFDDQGSQFDADGNLRMWWAIEDREKFEKRAQMIVEQYNEYTVLDSVHVNGKLTLGENIADIGGLTIAYDALMRSYQKKGGKPKAIDGFTAEQRFFLGWGQIWRSKYRNEVALERIKTDPHSPGYWRVNGTLSAFPAFFEAFGIQEGSKMRRNKDKIANIW
ncbi:MAG: M13 family peptidase [Cytophagales bacterium]|nr:MAG: M13 family peptidase [Cytophagales bacterium]